MQTEKGSVHARQHASYGMKVLYTRQLELETGKKDQDGGFNQEETRHETEEDILTT